MGRKRYILILIFLIIITSALLLGTSDSIEGIAHNYCAYCHMDIVENWESTYHSKVSCKSCHSKGLVQDSIGGARKIAITLLKQNEPENYKADILNTMCLQCHNIHASERNVLIVRQHERFVVRDYSCTRCHFDTGHATIHEYEAPDLLETYEIDNINNE